MSERNSHRPMTLEGSENFRASLKTKFLDVFVGSQGFGVACRSIGNLKKNQGAYSQLQSLILE